MADRKSDLNVRGAYLHMAADAAISLGVALAAIGVWYTGFAWLDPAVTLLIVVAIFAGTWGLLRDSVKLALHAAPENVNPAEVRRYLAALGGVAEVHDLHIWGMSTTETALTCHLIMPHGHPGDAALNEMAQQLHHRFGIQHATIQIELADSEEACALTPEHVV